MKGEQSPGVECIDLAFFEKMENPDPIFTANFESYAYL